MLSFFRRPAFLLTLLALVWLAVAGTGGPAVGSLSQVQTNDAAAFLPSDAGSTRAARALAAVEDTGTLPAVVLVERPAGTTPADRALLDALAADPGVPLAPGPPPVVVPSADGRALLLVLALPEDRETAAAAVEVLRATTGGVGGGARAWVTGPAGTAVDLGSAFGAVDGVLLLVALGAVLVVLLVVYRSPVLPFAVLTTSVVALALAGLVVRPLAQAGVLTLNGQSQGILSILVVGAATDYGLLLVARFREECLRTEDTLRALRRAWRAVLEPVAASALTVGAGLACLLLSSLESNRSLGPVAVVGIVAALLAATTFLPVLLALGRWVFWPRVPRPGDVGAAGAGRHRERRRGAWERVAGLVERRPRRTWLVTAAVLAAGAALFPAFRADGVARTDTFLTEVEAVAGAEVLAEHFPAGSAEPAEVVTTPADLPAVQRLAAAVPGVAAVAPGPADASVAVVRAVLADGPDTPAATATVQRLRAALADAGLDAPVGGTTATALDTLDAARADRAVVVPVVTLVVLVVLVLLLRSVLAAALLVACTVLSYAAVVGVSGLVFTHLLGFPGADPVVPLYAFVFLVALGVDYSIFLVTRVREESLRHGTRAGTTRGLVSTGGVITSAGVVLAATFAALAVVPLLFLAQLALLVASGVLVDTLLVRTLLVPGLLHDLGDRAWWPSRAVARRDGGATARPVPLDPAEQAAVDSQ